MGEERDTEQPREGAAADGPVRRRRAPRREIENAIREVRRAEKAATRPGPSANRPADAAASAPEPAASKSSASAEKAVPEAVAQRFVQVGSKYFFPDGTVAFTDRGRQLTTKSENRELIVSLVEIAQSRGWTEIGVRGSERFRKEAWLAARSVGLAVQGHRPTEFEEAQLVRRLAQARTPDPRPARDQAAAEPPAATQDAEPQPERRASQRRPAEFIAGKLLEHGRAPYRHDPREPMSYFVKLRTGEGERTLWGVDFERALRESVSRPRPGDEVALRRTRREAVTIKRVERDEAGDAVGAQDVGVQRNRWAVETKAFVEEQAAAAARIRDTTKKPAEAARESPELVGAYLYLRGAEEIAKREMSHPEDRARFVSIVREALATKIERGESVSLGKTSRSPLARELYSDARTR